MTSVWHDCNSGHDLQMHSIQPKTAWKQAFNNMKELGMPISDHQSNPPSCNGVSPGTFLVSTGKVTDTSQDQIQKPGSEEVRSVKWCWQKEKKIHTVGSNVHLSMKLSAIFPSVIYLSIQVHLSSSFYLSICLSSRFSSLLSSFHCFVSILLFIHPSMQIETPGLEQASLNPVWHKTPLGDEFIRNVVAPPNKRQCRLA